MISLVVSIKILFSFVTGPGCHDAVPTVQTEIDPDRPVDDADLGSAPAEQDQGPAEFAHFAVYAVSLTHLGQGDGVPGIAAGQQDRRGRTGRYYGRDHHRDRLWRLCFIQEEFGCGACRDAKQDGGVNDHAFSDAPLARLPPQPGDQRAYGPAEQEDGDDPDRQAEQ